MADPFVNFDPFAPVAKPTEAELRPSIATSPTPQMVGQGDPFINFDPFEKQAEGQTSKLGVALRGAVGAALPTAGAIRGGALGGEIGAAIGGPIGGFAGMLGGAYLGSEGMSTAQNWLLDKVPKFRDMLGQSEEQKRLDQKEHEVISFLGGMAPFAMTMSPMGALKKELPEGATLWQRLQNGPVTSRFISAGVVGGMQLGQEVASEDKVNWNRVAIATAFGLAFNKNNAIGTAISEYGAVPIRRAFNLPTPVLEGPPTIAKIQSSVTGPGLNETVFRGEEGRSIASEHAAIVQSGIEQNILNPRRQAVENAARQKEPELFATRDELERRANTFRNYINEQNEPRPYQFLELDEKRVDLETQLAEHMAGRGDRGGKLGRELREQIRDLQGQYGDLARRAKAYQEGTAVETPDVAEARRHLMATEGELRDVQTKVRAAYLDAAERTGAQVVTPPTPPVAAQDAIGQQLKADFEAAVVMHGRRSPEAGIAFDKLQAHRIAQPPPEVAAPLPAPQAETPAGAPAPGAAAEAAAPARSTAAEIETQKTTIAKDWEDQLVAVGVPRNRAQTSGQLMAIQYAAAASHLSEAKGDALEIYKAEAPRIVSGPGGKPVIVTPPPIPRTVEELHAYQAAGGKVTTAKGSPVTAPTAERTVATPPPIPTTVEELRAFQAAGGKVTASDGSSLPPPTGQPGTEGGVPIGTPTAEATPLTPPPPPTIKESPQQAWQSLLDLRREIEARSLTETGYNKKTSRRGAQIRPPARQEWTPGNVVDVEFVKDLLVSAKTEDGIFTLLAKPDTEGKSQSYTTKLHEGLAKGEKVDFLEAAKPLIEKAAAEPLPEVVAKKKGAARGPRATPPEKMSLLQFIADNGGIKDDPLIRKIFSGGNFNVHGWGNLIREDGGGKSLDRHLEAAMEGNGYLEKGSTLRDLENLIDAEGNRKQKQWRIGMAPPEKAIDVAEQRHRMDQALDDHLERLGNKPEDIPAELRESSLKIMERRNTNAEVAWEEAVTQEQQNAAEAGEIKLEPKGIPGWDEPLPNEPGAAPAGGSEAPPRGGQPEGANVGEAARPPGGSDREQAERTTAIREDEWADFFQGKGQLKKGSIDLSVMPPEMRLTKYWDESTLIHEPAHAWLEQLMRDAEHPAAPAWLVQDAATVVRELAIGSPEVLLETRTTRTGRKVPTERATEAHEKFARAFERYMYDGVAPTPQIEGVFARFKSWLMQIYDTVKKLAANKVVEISPHMRAVFDRMLTETPHETVIGEHAERGPTLQDIHAGDATAIPPAEAEVAAERVAAESEQYAKDQPPQVIAGVEAKARAAGIETKPTEGAEPAREGEPVPGGPSEVVRGGGAAEPQPPRGGVRPEHGAVEQGGANARPEGATIPGATERPGEQPSAAEREHPLAPTPARDRIPPSESKDVDLAGNIRTRLLDSRERIRRAMMDSAARKDDYRAVRGQPVTDEMLWQMAADHGMDASKVDLVALKNHLEHLFGGLRDAAPKMLAGRQMVKDMANDVAELSRAADLSKAPEDIYAATQAIMRLDMAMTELSGGTASWGRTGRALRDISGAQSKDAIFVQKLLKENTGRTFNQMQDFIRKIAQYDSTSQVNKFVRDSGLHPWRMLLEIWINGLISGLPTHMTYGVGNTITALEKVGPDTALAAGIGAIRKAMGRQGDTVRIGEVAAGLRGMRRGIAPSLLSALQSAETNTTTLLRPDEKTRFIAPLTQGGIAPSILNEAATYSDVMQKLYGISAGVRDGLVAGAKLQASGGVEGAPLISTLPSRYETPNIQIRGVTVPTGELATAPSRMIAAIHSFFRPLNYTTHIETLAYREAANHPIEGISFDQQIANFRQSPPQWAIEDAINVSNKATLMDQGGEFTRKLSAFINHEFLGKTDAEGKHIPGTGLPILKFIDPFIHISSAIIRYGIVEHTPVGILSPAIRADLLGHNGTIRADLAAGRMLAGTAFSLLFGFLAAEGYVTGSGPSNPDDAALWRQVYQPHSVRIGDTWYAMNRLGPMGMLMSTAADLYDIAPHVAEGDFAKAASALGHAVAQNILDESFMRGPSDLLKAIDQSDRYGPSYVRNFLASFIPFSTQMRYMASSMDPYTRQARTITDTLRAHTPGLSMDLFPRRDTWGEPMPSRYGLGGDLTAIWEQRINSDPTNQALVDLGIHVGVVGRKIRNVTLNDEQYDDFSRIAGRLAKLRMDAIVRSPSFQSMPPGARQDLVNEQLKQSREVARNMMFMKYPSILTDAHTQKMQRFYGYKQEQ